MRIILIALTALGLLAAACGGSTAPSQTLSITVSEFTYAPVSWEIKANAPTNVTVINKGVLEHDFTIASANFTLLVPASKTLSKELKALQPGTYEVHCTVAGHKEAGMVGTLTVK